MTSLARHLGFFALFAYALGDILGAGIYILVGQVIGLTGVHAWVSFLLSAVVALLTGLSYAEMSARYPVGGGAASFIQRGFSGKLLATLAGVFIMGTGLSSAATVSMAFSGYLQELVSIPPFLGRALLVCVISFLSFWGIRESSRVNYLLTFVELSGLIAVILGGVFLINPESFENFIKLSTQNFDLAAIGAGVTLSFFAYIGFEDISNLALESKNPARDIPRALLLALGIATVVYLLVTFALLLNVPLETIKHSQTPLLLIFEKLNLGWIVRYFSIIAIMAVANTGLLNMIMVSRLMHGMSEENLLPTWVGKVHPKRKTPWVGVIITGGSVLALILTGGVKILAQTTSFLIVVVFLMVHLSLIRLKWKKEKHQGMKFHATFPILGALVCFGFLTQFPLEVYLRSLIFIGIGLMIWVIFSRKKSKKQ